MNIIAVMAIDTKNISIAIFFEGLNVATMAMQSVVCPFYLKIGFVVIKFPDQPVVGVMTVLTFLSQCAFMDIVIAVAIITF